MEKYLLNKLRSKYHDMLQRCNNPNTTGYHRYGGRGIKVCEKWQIDFIFFYADCYQPFKQYIKDIGQLPEIDRIDNDGDYEASNCRWIDRDGNMLNSTAHNKQPIEDRYKDLTYTFNDLSVEQVILKLMT